MFSPLLRFPIQIGFRDQDGREGGTASDVEMAGERCFIVHEFDPSQYNKQR